MKDLIITQLFMGVLSMSLTAALIGLSLIVIHPFTEKYFSKKWNYYIWLLVLVRLALPLHFNTAFPHALNFRADIQQMQPAAYAYPESTSDALGNPAAHVTPSLPALTQLKNIGGKSASGISNTQPSADAAHSQNTHLTKNTADAKPSDSIFSVTIFLTIMAYLWLFGVLAVLFIKLFHYHLFQSQIKRDRIRITDHRITLLENAFCLRLGIQKVPAIYESGFVSGPLTIGLWNPVIMIPKGIICEIFCEDSSSGQNLTQFQLMLHHELIHVARRDLLYKWTYQLLLCIHWFNPLLYWFGRQINRDCELSCDEAILAHLTDAGRQMYGNILLDTAARNIECKNSAFSTTLLENKKDLKKRLDNILRRTKRTRFRVAFSTCVLIMMLLLSACSSIWIAMDDTNEHKEQQSSDDFSSDTFLANFSKAHKYGDAWNVYDDDSLIAGNDVCDNWGAYNYFGGQNLTASRMVLYGSDTVLIAYADKDIEVDITSSFDVVEGKFKIVYISPDGNVSTINDTGSESKQAITMKEGRNVIKMVGQGAKLKKLALNYSDIKISDFEKVYFTEDEEYIAQLSDSIKTGEPVEKDRVLDALYMFSDKKDVSDIFNVLLISRVPFTSDELCDFFIYSDTKLSSKFLVEAIEDGYQKPLDAEAVSAVMPYIDEKYMSSLLIQLPPESFYDTLKDNLFYMDSDQIKECLTDYIQNGGTLTYAEFSDVSFYMNENDIRELSTMLSE
ncbi:MAG: M56 family metallopeptidase [Lachnospiraceae bacterium]|nr:M56 family metallopeptidase [Lachnospiraceae bacterium]